MIKAQSTSWDSEWAPFLCLQMKMLVAKTSNKSPESPAPLLKFSWWYRVWENGTPASTRLCHTALSVPRGQLSSSGAGVHAGALGKWSIGRWDVGWKWHYLTSLAPFNATPHLTLRCSPSPGKQNGRAMLRHLFCMLCLSNHLGAQRGYPFCCS